jgi:hypothetical protein
MPHNQILFCPFCRESFEGRDTCPEHDLALVGFEKLGPDPFELENLPEVIDQTPLATVDPAFGRGWVAGGALLIALAFPCEFVRVPGLVPTPSTGQLAGNLPSLWTLALVSFTLLFILKRRNTPRALRSVRLLVPLLALVPVGTVAWVLHRLEQGIFVYATGQRIRGGQPSVAVYLIGIASLLIFFGGLRLGALPSNLKTRL